MAMMQEPRVCGLCGERMPASNFRQGRNLCKGQTGCEAKWRKIQEELKEQQRLKCDTHDGLQFRCQRLEKEVNDLKLEGDDLESECDDLESECDYVECECDYLERKYTHEKKRNRDLRRIASSLAEECDYQEKRKEEEASLVTSLAYDLHDLHEQREGQNEEKDMNAQKMAKELKDMGHALEQERRRREKAEGVQLEMMQARLDLQEQQRKESRDLAIFKKHMQEVQEVLAMERTKRHRAEAQVEEMSKRIRLTQ